MNIVHREETGLAIPANPVRAVRARTGDGEDIRDQCTMDIGSHEWWRCSRLPCDCVGYTARLVSTTLSGNGGIALEEYQEKAETI